MIKKRIAIITVSFSGATLPLAKHLSDDGYYVDYYVIANKYVNLTEGVSFRAFQSHRFVGEILSTNCQGLFDYLNSDNVHLYYYNRPRGYKRVPLLRGIVSLYLSFRDKLFSKHINHCQYDWVNLVGTHGSDEFNNFIKYINRPLVVSLHEVIPSLINKDNIKTPKWFKRLFSSNAKIVVHSQNTYNDIRVYKGLDLNKVNVIHFGLFETYKTIVFDEKITEGLPPNYILFFGNILPYKGLDVLYKAVIQNRKCFNEHKIVVAGRGYVDCLSEIRKDESFICINRRVSNEELASLISHSLIVVCPYRAASQSGIPQTTFVFNKPIIASNLDAFREVLTNGYNCLLFESENCDDLAEKVSEMISNYDYYRNNVSRFELDNPEYSWRNIANYYEKLMYVD